MGTTATAEMLLLLLALVFAAAVRTSEPQQKDEDSVVGRRMMGRGLFELDWIPKGNEICFLAMRCKSLMFLAQ